MNRFIRSILAGLAAAGASAAAPAAARAVVCRVELDRSVLPAERPAKAVIKVSLEAPASKRADRPPVNIALVLDRSGSMAGGKLEKMQEAAIEAIRRLGRDDYCAVVAYNHDVQTIAPAQPVSRMEDVERLIRSFSASGNTALFGGVSQGANEVRRYYDRKFVNRVILLSDGQANVGPSSPEELGRLGTAMAKESLSVTTIGVGNDYNEDLMTRLSQAGEGNTYFVENSNDLPRIFAKEIGDVLNVVARDVVIEITCSDGVRPVRILGREGRIDGRRVRVDLPQLYGGQEKYALVEVEVEPGAEGAKREIATATCRYEDLVTRKAGQSQGQTEACFSRDTDKIEKSGNAGVQREYMLNVAAKEQDEAIVLNDQGKQKDAADKLQQNAKALRELGEKLGDAELKRRADLYENRAAGAAAGRLDSRDRKEMRAESYQTTTQQAAP